MQPNFEVMKPKFCLLLLKKANDVLKLFQNECRGIRYRTTHLYVIPEEDGRHHELRPDEGQSDELPQFFRPLGQQDLYRLPQVRHDEKPRRKVALLKAHAGAAEHHPFHRRRVHRRHPISHKPAVAHPHEAESPNAGCLHGGHDALGLV